MHQGLKYSLAAPATFTLSKCTKYLDKMLHPQSILVSQIQVLGSWSSKKNFYRKYRNASSMCSIKDVNSYTLTDED